MLCEDNSMFVSVRAVTVVTEQLTAHKHRCMSLRLCCAGTSVMVTWQPRDTAMHCAAATVTLNLLRCLWSSCYKLTANVIGQNHVTLL